MSMYLILNFVLVFASKTFDGVSFVVKAVLKKSSTGVAKINRNTAVTSKAHVPTSVCFNNLITGLTWRPKFFM